MTDYMELLLRSRDGLLSLKAAREKSRDAGFRRRRAEAELETAEGAEVEISSEKTAMDVAALLVELEAEKEREETRFEQWQGPEAIRAGAGSLAMERESGDSFSTAESREAWSAEAGFREFSDFFERDARRCPGAFETF